MTATPRALALLLVLLMVLTACSAEETTGDDVATDEASEVPAQDEDPAEDQPADEGATDDEPADDEPAEEESADGEPEPGGSFPVTVTADNGEVTVEAAPTAIVSLSPTATEMLFAMGAGDQVVAVDAFSNFPEAAPTTDLSGFQPNVEAILGYEPDLVVGASDPGDLVDGLAAVGVPAVLFDAAADLDDAYAQIEVLGAITGNLDGASLLVAEMSTEIDDLIAGLPELDAPLTYFHELDPTLFSVTGATFIGQVYSLLGLESIADEAEDAGDFPQLNAEFVAAADPDFVFLADTLCCEVDAEEFGSRPGFEDLSAVRRGAVIELDDDIASRWGPRVVEFIEIVTAAVLENLPEGVSAG